MSGAGPPTLFQGAAAYRAEGSWPPGAAVAATVAISAASLLIAGIGIPASVSVSQMLPLIVMQAVALVLTIWAAGLRGDDRAAVLALRRPAQGWPILLPALGLILTLAVCSAAVTAIIAPETFQRDLGPMRGIVQRESPVLAFGMVAVGAPLSEELLFRGFLFSALARSRIGVMGAALATTLGWTALHAGYSIIGLIEVAAAGLLFSWLLVRTGSLWVPIICHAVHNAAILAVLTWLKLPVFG